MITPQGTADSPQPALLVAHVPSVRRCYPGETITFFTRLVVLAPLKNATLRISIPDGLIAGAAGAPPDWGHLQPELQPFIGGHDIVWHIPGKLAAGTTAEYHLQATAASVIADLNLQSRAVASATRLHGKPATATEFAGILVQAQADYLRYLPAFYVEDDFMARFLMLFESFWRPIDQQIDAIPNYFDPQLTPPQILPWLASWISLTLDERWPEDRRRLLLSSAAYLYRKRGTKAGLQRHLEIYTGVTPEITEHRANNFKLGKNARMGIGVALGRRNQPHTFTVTLHLPPIEVPAEFTGNRTAEKNRLTRERRRIIESIIEAEKPAHTTCILNCE